MKPKESHLSQHEELIQDCVRSDAMSEILTAENSSEDGNGGEDFIDSNEDLVFKKYIQDEDKPTKEGEGVSKSKGIIEVFSDYLESIFSTEEEHDEEIEEELTAMYWLLWKILNYTLGVIAVVVILTKYPQYLDILHENQLWFSNIKEIEREISFRTEQGLYYSYFKEIIKAPSWIEGCNQLMKDNSTEHGRTINIIHRFNILPEIVLSAAFRWLSSQESPSVFYVSSVFGLHGVFISALYVTAWYLSGSVLAGMITVILFVIHRIDTTRVNYTVPLRESFAIPFLFFQIFVMCTFIKSGRCQIVKLAVIFIMSVVFLQSWQFAAFILLCQLFCLVSLGRLLLLSAAKVNKLVLVLGASLLVSCTIQANPPLVISSPALSMVVPALILSATHTPDRTMGSVIRMIITTAELSLLLFVTVLINGSIKYWGKILSELWPEEVYEFWDPDTVELMEWIQSSTPPEAVFAGSMQLLAGVKLCTGRHITNHPHYEDSWLRQRTHQIYQIYGKETPEVVYAALKSAGATHIILEDSICFIPPDEQHPLCRLTDIIDLHNGHMPEYGGQDIPGLIEPLYGRFCDKIRYKIAEYNRFFSLVLSNKTFRVYRVAVT
nr:probable C-mannosyltransferase DPY19L3 isoform X6 [Cherax quadricarinatus]